MALNPQRAKVLEQAQTSMAQKVLGCMMFETQQSTKDIVRVMASKGFSNDYHAIEGCLRQLVECGLVRKPDQFTYIRVPVKATKLAIVPNNDDKEESTMPLSAQPKPVVERTLFQRLSEASNVARSLAEELDTIALELEDALSKDSEKRGKLEQLAALLKQL